MTHSNHFRLAAKHSTSINKNIVRSRVQLCKTALNICCCLVARSCPTLLWPHGLQHTKLPCPFIIFQSLLRFVSSESVMLSVSTSAALFSCLQSSTASESFPIIQLFESEGQNIGASASASFLPINTQGRFPFCPRDSQESSLSPQFESISSLVLSLLDGSTLTSVHDYWKNPSFDYTDLCQRSEVSAF